MKSSFAVLCGLLAPCALVAQAGSPPPYLNRDNPNAAHDEGDGRYTIPYQLPKPEEIRGTLASVFACLAAEPADLVIDQQTGRAITDFSVPDPQAQLRGHRFPLLAYPTGVLYGSLLLASEATGDSRYANYVATRFQFMTDRLPYFDALAKKAGTIQGNRFRNLIAPGHLDGCGALGAAMVKARRAGIGPDLKPVIDRFADYVSHRQFRLADGTIARPSPQPESLWADDLYMAVPLLAQLGQLTGDRAYYDDAVRQVLQISARLFNWDRGLFAHGWSGSNPDHNLRIYWGRANGWCLMALCELLEVLPADHPGRPAVLKILQAQARGLAELQSGQGLWHQVLDREDSYLETSCTAMFTFGLARAVNRGWIAAASFGPIAQAGWNGLTTKITPDGHVLGTCVGTNFASDFVYYYHRPALDDAHGYGPVIFAGAEMLRFLTNPHLDLKYQGRTYIHSVRP